MRRWMRLKMSWIIWMLMMKMTIWISKCFNTLATMNKQHEMTLRDRTSQFGDHLPFLAMCSSMLWRAFQLPLLHNRSTVHCQVVSYRKIHKNGPHKILKDLHHSEGASPPCVHGA